MKAWMSSNFGKFAIELRPWINVRIEFLLNILKTNRPIKTKFCIHIFIDKIYVGIVIILYRKFATELWPLIDARLWFLLNIIKRIQNKTKFFIHIIINKIYVRIVNLCFFFCKLATELRPFIDVRIWFYSIS